MIRSPSCPGCPLGAVETSCYHRCLLWRRRHPGLSLSERLGAGIGGQAAGLTLAQVDLVETHPLALHRLLPQARLGVQGGVMSDREVRKPVDGSI